MAQFDFYLNRQGTRGPQGVQGKQGFSPIITVATNTLSEYVLQIQTQNNTFLTANLREHKEDLGGTYIRYNRETGVMYAGDADVASQSQLGVVRFATATDIEREDESSVVSPADVADMIAAVDPSGDITDLQNRVTTLEGKTESLEGSVSDNSLAISALQSSVSGLLTNYVPKTRTINGYALSSNITLTASDVNAYNKTETNTLLANKANVSDLPDMNNYYNTTQIDLMLNEKADISDIPTVPTNVSAFTNDAGYITSSDLPTVGNGTITFTQGGVTKGSITTNQSGDTTIALDAGGGGGSSYTAGNGIDITNDVISVDFTDVATASQGTKADTAVQPSDLATVATTGDYDDLINKPIIPVVPTNISSFTNDAGYITSASLPDISNMVTTDTNQTIVGLKTFNDALATQYIKNVTGTANVITVSNSTTNFNCSNGLSVTKGGNTYTVLDSGNIGTYALTSLPTATTSVLGGVIPDGTTITVDANGTIHGASTYVLPTASTSTLGGVKIDGTSITIDANGVISSSGGGSLPSQTGHDGDVLTTDGTDASWIETADIIDAGSELSGMAMPSDTSETLTIGASGTQYTAPANGYYTITGYFNSNNWGEAYVQLASDTHIGMTGYGTGSNGIYAWVYIPVKKGDVVSLNYYNLNTANASMYFVYAVGSESEAS